MSLTLQDALRRLAGVRRCGAGFVAFCPAHPDGQGHRERSLSIRETQDGKVLLNCFAGCSYRAILSALQLRSPAHLKITDLLSPRPAADESKKREIIQRIWCESRSAPGTRVETYLRSRGITMRIPPALRFHPSLRHPTGVFLPAMVAAVQDRGGRVVAIHRTFLAPDGSGKANVEPSKAMLGPCVGRAVHLVAAGEILCLCEGIETGLSVLQSTSVSVWVALGASNLSRVELPEIVREVIICADNDPHGAGERAAIKAAWRFQREGRRARIATPEVGDFNDLLMK